MKIIQRRQRHESTYYRLMFEYVGQTGSGFSFNCDKDGKVDTDKLNPVALNNYSKI